MPGPAVVGEGVRATLAHIGGRTEDAERMYAEAAAAMSRQGSPHAAGHLAIATATLLASRGLMGRSVAWARQVHEGFGPLAADLLAVALAEAGRRHRPGRSWPRRGRSPRTTSSRSSGPSAR